MHPLIQYDLALVRQGELLQATEAERFLSRLQSPAERRARWVPTRVHLALFRLRLRRQAHRQRLARRHYATSWRAEVRRLLDEE